MSSGSVGVMPAQLGLPFAFASHFAPAHLKEAAYSLESFPVGVESNFVGKSIRDCGIRERGNALVVGVERSGQRILNPSADFRIDAGDLLWIVGQREKVRSL